jgi:hypothetical protein
MKMPCPVHVSRVYFKKEVERMGIIARKIRINPTSCILILSMVFKNPKIPPYNLLEKNKSD